MAPSFLKGRFGRNENNMTILKVNLFFSLWLGITHLPIDFVNFLYSQTNLSITIYFLYRFLDILFFVSVIFVISTFLDIIFTTFLKIKNEESITIQATLYCFFIVLSNFSITNERNIIILILSICSIIYSSYKKRIYYKLKR